MNFVSSPQLKTTQNQKKEIRFTFKNKEEQIQRPGLEMTKLVETK
jgi:hypothetical protein